MKLILRCLWTAYDYISTPEARKESDFMVVGGVSHSRMYQYPETPQQALGWMVRKILSVEEALKNIPYPDPTSQSIADALQGTLKLPDYVFTMETDQVKVGVWDETK
jgi:hypothetical protein